MELKHGDKIIKRYLLSPIYHATICITKELLMMKIQKKCNRILIGTNLVQLLMILFKRQAEYRKAKNQTYKTLRRKLVKKYPQYKNKYEKQGHDDESSEYLSETNSISKKMNSFYFATMKSFSNQINHPRKEKINYFRYIKFYSRSKKRCLTNHTQQFDHKPKKAQQSIPKLSYLQYLKNADERKKLQSISIQGTNLEKKKQKILKIQKEGTRSYARLKKSLEEALDSCIVKI